jgi:calcineurin-like phosphoesterase family protein
MSKTYFTSDWHFGHKAILKYRKFTSIEQHDRAFIDNFNKVVRKRDTVFFMGDIAFTQEGLDKLSELNFCKKILYLGNHDTLKTEEYLKYFDEVHALRSYKGYWLSHCPIHPQEMRSRKGCIHGHLHASVLKEQYKFSTSWPFISKPKKYFDVSPEKHNYELVSFEHIKETLKGLS